MFDPTTRPILSIVIEICLLPTEKGQRRFREGAEKAGVSAVRHGRIITTSCAFLRCAYANTSKRGNTGECFTTGYEESWRRQRSERKGRASFVSLANKGFMHRTMTRAGSDVMTWVVLAVGWADMCAAFIIRSDNEGKRGKEKEYSRAVVSPHGF